MMREWAAPQNILFSVAEKMEKEGSRIFTNTVYLVGIFALIFVLLGLGLSGKITDLLGADGQIFGTTEIYLKTILLFAPAFMANDFLLCFVRNDGSPGLAISGDADRKFFQYHSGLYFYFSSYGNGDVWSCLCNRSVSCD